MVTVSITPEQKAQVISEYRLADNDTGSAEVQIAILTTRIRNLTEHFKAHAHDFNSRRGLLCLVGQRRSMLRYLKTRDIQRYRSLIDRLGLRK